MTRKILLIVLPLLIVVLAGLGVFHLTRQPDKTDYQKLDTDRQALDMSMNTYGPVFEIFSTEYSNVYREERAADEKTVLKSQYAEILERDRRINRERLKRMESSLALREPSVKAAFETFKSRYGAVIDYSDQYGKNIANITESIAGPCAKLSQLNVAKSSYGKDYVKAADTCLSSLASAKQTSDATTDTLLSDVETLVKTRRDKFNETIGKEGAELSVASMLAIISLLDINSELKGIQDRYETTVRNEYNSLITDANKANKALEDSLKASTVSGIAKGGEA